MKKRTLTFRCTEIRCSSSSSSFHRCITRRWCVSPPPLPPTLTPTITIPLLQITSTVSSTFEKNFLILLSISDDDEIWRLLCDVLQHMLTVLGGNEWESIHREELLITRAPLWDIFRLELGSETQEIWPLCNQHQLQQLMLDSLFYLVSWLCSSFLIFWITVFSIFEFFIIVIIIVSDASPSCLFR